MVWPEALSTNTTSCVLNGSQYVGTGSGVGAGVVGTDVDAGVVGTIEEPGVVTEELGTAAREEDGPTETDGFAATDGSERPNEEENTSKVVDDDDGATPIEEGVTNMDDDERGIATLDDGLGAAENAVEGASDDSMATAPNG